MKAIGFSKIKEGDLLFVLSKDGGFTQTLQGRVTQLNRGGAGGAGRTPGWTELTLDNAYGFELYEGDVVILLDRPKVTPGAVT